MKKRLIFSAMLIVLLIGSTACGTKSNTKSAFNFQVHDIQGKSVLLSHKKPTLIYFMAAWCPSCVHGEKVFNKMHQQYKGHVQLMTVDVAANTDTKKSLAKFQKSYGGNWPHVLKNGVKIAKTYGVKQLEEVVLLNSNHKKVYEAVHPSVNDLTKQLADIGVKP